MSAQVYSVPDQTAGTRKPFLEWKCPVLSLTYRGNVSYYKIVHHPFPTCWNTEHPGTFQNKSLSSPINWVSRYILFLVKLKGRGRPYLTGARRVVTLWDYPQKHLVVIRNETVFPFVKSETILLLLCFFKNSLQIST